jgi:acetoin utilization deacetylase AcuC-like enzyme
MKLLYNPVFLKHNLPFHPENPKRLSSFHDLETTEIPDGEKYITLYHTSGYIEHVRSACASSTPLDPDTHVSPTSFEAAVHAVGAAIMASENGDFALVRPPGHHAHPDRASGFCLFNNVGIAVQKLVNEGKRVLIFDFDGHHGDGSSHFFARSNQVFYWSIHQEGAFPNDDMEEHIGYDEGAGYSINLPIPAGSGDDIFQRAMKQFLPYAKAFNPDAVAVSAGFDSHSQDLLLDLNYSYSSFFEAGKMLRENFHDIFAVLEGGYNISTLETCVNAFVSGVNGEPFESPDPQTESKIIKIDEFEATASRVERKLRPYWPDVRV